MRILIVVLFFICSLFSRQVAAQGTVVLMKDSVRVNTELLSIKDNLLLVKEGALSLSLIYSVNFLDSTEAERKSVLVNALLERGIIVFSNGKKLVPDKSAPEISDEVVVTNKPAPTIVDEEKANALDDTSSESSNTSLMLGIGIGLDYGGLGGKLTFSPQKSENTQLGVFIAGGYALSGLGFNSGLILRIQPEKRMVPTFTAMYGYNSVIKVVGAPQYDKIYYGASIGAGFESKSRNDNGSHFHAELILPFRPTSFTNDLKALQNNPSIEISDPFPVMISIGYHFML